MRYTVVVACSLIGCLPKPQKDYTPDEIASIQSLEELMRVQAHHADPLFAKRERGSFSDEELAAMKRAAAILQATSVRVRSLCGARERAPRTGRDTREDRGRLGYRIGPRGAGRDPQRLQGLSQHLPVMGLDPERNRVAALQSGDARPWSKGNAAGPDVPILKHGRRRSATMAGHAGCSAASISAWEGSCRNDGTSTGARCSTSSCRWISIALSRGRGIDQLPTRQAA
jgi:hypothetical protein